MKSLETPLIRDRASRQLSALGYKQLSRIADKAAEANGTNRYAREFKPMYEQVKALVYSLIFDHNVTKEQLSKLQKAIKVVNNKLELPSIASL